MFDGARALALLESQVAMGPRCPGSPGHRRARGWLLEQLAAAGARDITVDDFAGDCAGVPVPLSNIAADLGPRGDAPVLLAAHWDTRPWADRDPDPARRNEPIPGANDGASGVAVVLEVARVARPAVPVRVVLFDGEDLGRDHVGYSQGARRFAGRLRGVLPRWGLLLDMVGDAVLEIPREAYSERHAGEIVRKVWDAARALGHEAVFVDRPGPGIKDDHLALIEAGVPMVDLIDFDYPWWHTLGDTPDRCSAASLEAVGRVVTATLESEC